MSEKQLIYLGVGALAAYALFRYLSVGARISFSASAGADSQGFPAFGGKGNDLAYRGNQPAVPYDPLGTVGGYPGTPNYGGYGAYIGFGGSGEAGGGAGYASRIDRAGVTNPYGTVNMPTEDCNGCAGGAKA